MEKKDLTKIEKSISISRYFDREINFLKKDKNIHIVRREEYAIERIRDLFKLSLKKSDIYELFRYVGRYVKCEKQLEKLEKEYHDIDSKKCFCCGRYEKLKSELEDGLTNNANLILKFNF